jgi:hypothetical protein
MRVTAEIGGRAEIGVVAELHDGTRQMDAKITVESYVRDVVGR